jgi:hypothetical protein
VIVSAKKEKEKIGPIINQCQLTRNYNVVLVTVYFFQKKDFAFVIWSIWLREISRKFALMFLSGPLYSFKTNVTMAF